MNIHRYLAGATVAVALTIAYPANAGLLGGNAAGAVNGSLSGRMGDVSGMADGRATGSIGAQTGAIDRAGQRTRDIGGRAKDRTQNAVGTARDRSRSAVDGARSTTVDASAQAAATGTAAANSGIATASGSLDTVSSAQSGAESTLSGAASTAGSTGSEAEVPRSGGQGGFDVTGDVSKSVSTSKSLEAGDRTFDAMADSSTQGSAGAQGDSESLNLTGAANSQSNAAVKTGRKVEEQSQPQAEPENTPAPAGDRYDNR